MRITPSTKEPYVGHIPQLLSDHPANGTRIRTLEKHFCDNPSTFSKFSPAPMGHSYA